MFLQFISDCGMLPHCYFQEIPNLPADASCAAVEFAIVLILLTSLSISQSTAVRDVSSCPNCFIRPRPNSIPRMKSTRRMISGTAPCRLIASDRTFSRLISTQTGTELGDV